MAPHMPEHEGRTEKTSIDMLFRTIDVTLNFSILIRKRGMLAIFFCQSQSLSFSASHSSVNPRI